MSSIDQFIAMQESMEMPPDGDGYTAEPRTEPCILCGKPIEGHVSRYCCNGSMCACGGRDINPPICSEACDAALMGSVGTLEERRIKAGIPKYAPCYHCGGTGQVIPWAAAVDTVPCSLCAGTGIAHGGAPALTIAEIVADVEARAGKEGL